MAERLYFGKIEEVIEPPNLIEVQSRSYEDFLQKEVPAGERTDTGLQAVFREVFPIKSYDEAIELDFVTYDIEEPKITSLEALRNGETFSAALYVTFKLKDETGTKKERVYMGELPMMTRRGTFVINGAERVDRLPAPPLAGYLLRDLASTSTARSSTRSASSRTADRGSRCSSTPTTCSTSTSTAAAAAASSSPPPSCARSATRPTATSSATSTRSRSSSSSEKMDEEELGHKVPFEDILDGEVVVAKAYEPLTIGIVRQLLALGHKNVEVIDGREDEILLKSLRKDPANDEESALKDIYRKLRPGDPPTAANARALLKRLFFDPKKYDLTRVGRYKINQKLGIDVDSDERIMVPEDFLAAVQVPPAPEEGRGRDRRHRPPRQPPRACGGRTARQPVPRRPGPHRASGQGAHDPLRREHRGHDAAEADQPEGAQRRGARLLRSLASSRQFMDQTNPLAELTHKRRLSALGPGGLNRDRAGFEVRDVHPSHYGRICPIETPEGPNIGLINSMCTYARINEFGFIETPYRRVKNGKVTNEIEYLTADQEENFLIAQANNPIDKSGKFLNRTDHRP